MQSDIGSQNYSPLTPLCTMCSIIMFVAGTFMSIAGIVFLSDPNTPGNLVVGLFTLGIGAILLLLGTSCCCYVGKERSRQLKYVANTSSMAQKLDRIEARLAQQSNAPFSINPPVPDMVVVQFISFCVIEDFIILISRMKSLITNILNIF